MALTHDTKLRIPATALATTTSAASAAYTCGANAKLLVVMICYAGVTQRTGGAPTYNGVALQQAQSLAGVTEAACELWYMLAPPVSQSLTVAVPNDNGRTMWVYVASANAASGYTCAVDSSGITETTGSSPSVSYTAVASGTIAYAVVATGDNTFAPTARTGTSLYEEDIATYGSGAQYYVKSGTGSQALSWTDTTSEDYGAIAAAFKEIPAPLVVSPDPASCVAAKVDPVVVHGSITVAPPAASVVAAKNDPTVVKGSIILGPAAASAVASKGDPNAGYLPGYLVSDNITSFQDAGYRFQRKSARTSNGDLHYVYHRTISGHNEICYAISTDDGGTWSETQLTSGTFAQTFPTIAADSGDNLHVAWVGKYTAMNEVQIRYMKYADGVGWGSIQNLTSDSNYKQTYGPAIAINSSNYVHVVWSAETDLVNFYTNIRYRQYTTSWQDAVYISSGNNYLSYPCIAVDSNDYVHVGARGSLAGDSWTRVYYILYNGTWQAPATVTPDTIDCRYPCFAIDSSDTIHCVYTKSTDIFVDPGNICYRYNDGSWSAETELTTGSTYDQLDSGISIDASGYLHVAWEGKHADSGGKYQVRYRLYNGTWQAIENLTNLNYDQRVPNMVWAYHPIISGQRTNRPKTGYALIWANGNIEIRYLPSSNLTWDMPSVIVTPAAASCVAASQNPTIILGSIIFGPAASSAIATKIDPTVVNNVTLEPAAASCIAAKADPAIVQGSLILAPVAASAIAATPAPTVILGSVTVSPTAASAVASKAEPTILNNVTLSPAAGSAVAVSVDPTVINNVTLSPGASSTIAASVDPTVVQSSLTLTPAATSAIASKVDPTVQVGGVLVAPEAASCVAASVSPVVVLGSVIVTPAAASVISSSTGPTVINNVMLSPSPAAAIGASSGPAVILGSIIVAPAAASAIASKADPTVIRGSVTVTPMAASCISQVLAPTVVFGSVVVSPASASGITGRAGPIVINNVIIAPAAGSAIATTLNPTVVLGSVTAAPNPASAVASKLDPSVQVGGTLLITPAPASAIAASQSPIVVYGSVTIGPVAASTRATSTGPVVVLGSLSISPAAASAVCASLSPTVIAGNLNIVPPASSVVAACVSPTVIYGSLAITPAPASAVAEKVDPIVAGMVTAYFYQRLFMRRA